MIKHSAGGDPCECLVLLRDPGPGIAHFFATSMGGMTYVSVRVFFFGEGAADTAAREEAAWSAWLEENFPALVPAEA